MDNMENKNKFWKGVMVGVLVTAFVCLVTVGTSVGIYMFGQRMMGSQVQVQTGNKEEGTSSTAQAPLELGEVIKTLKQIEQLVDTQYLFKDKINVDQERSGILNGFLFGLNDPYAAYYSPEDLEKFKEDTSGKYCGIGATVAQDAKTGQVTVARVFEGSPAEEAGMLPGDVIYSVAGHLASETDLNLLISQYIRGEEGTKVDIRVYRKQSNEYKDLSVERRNIDAQTVTAKMLPGSIGYVEVTNFDTVTADQFKQAVDKLTGQGMKKMIIDLRNNPGGELDTVVAMCDYLLKDGDTIVSIVDSQGNKTVETAKDGHSLDIPMVVLVNGNSASASEVMTGALKDNKEAKIVGTKTFGKGIVQQLFSLSDGGALKLTVAHYYTPNGTDIHGKGIEPDVKVELNENLDSMLEIPADQDNQLQEAIKVIQNMN